MKQLTVIGTEAMKKTVGTTFGDIKLHRKDRILSSSDDHTNVLQHENEDPNDLTQSDDSSDEDGVDLQEDSSDSDDHLEVPSAFISTSRNRVKKTRKCKLTSE